MYGINTGRIFVGAILAGIVYNLGQTVVHMVVLAEQSAAFSESLGVSGEPTGGEIGMYWFIGFIIGATMVKLYAAVRPRFGPGVLTALIVAVFTFTLAELVPMLFFVTGGLYEFGAYLPFLISTFVLLCVSSVAGAWAYTEDDGAGAAPAAPAAPPPTPPSPPDSAIGSADGA